MKKSIVLWSLVIPILLLVVWEVNQEKSCVSHVERAPCKSPLIDELLAAAVVEEPVPVNFQLDLGTRFSPIDLQHVQEARRADDFMTTNGMGQVASYQKVTVAILDDYRITDRTAEGNTPELNANQRSLLSEAKLSDNIMIRVDYMERDPQSGQLTESYRSPHLTIAPVQQAVYGKGKQAVLDYFRTNIQPLLNDVLQSQLKSGKMYFTITTEGRIQNPQISESSGYAQIDQKMVLLAQNMKGLWLPARNKEGQKVDQKLVISFGILGC